MPARPTGRRGSADRALQALLVGLTVGVLAVPAVVAAHSLHEARKSVRVFLVRSPVALQAAPPAVPPGALRGLPASLRNYRDGVPILAYHGVDGRRGDRYTAEPKQFAAQMAALRAQHFHTITADQLAAYVAGKPVTLPYKPIVISFDDGIKSVWSIADPILHRYKLRGLMFLITGSVSHRQPYYLTWQEVERMQRSGRWDFGSHTHDGHHFILNSPRGTGAFLTTRMYSPAQHTRESIAQWRARVTGDLGQSIKDFAAHHLPRPQVFADPFSSTAGREVDRELVGRLLRIERGFFGVLTNNKREPTPALAGRPDRYIHRIEVFHTMTPASMLREINQTVGAGPARGRS